VKDIEQAKKERRPGRAHLKQFANLELPTLVWLPAALGRFLYGDLSIFWMQVTAIQKVGCHVEAVVSAIGANTRHTFRNLRFQW